MTRIVLIRHAEPEEAAHGRVYGRLDVGLSEEGRRQCRALGAWFCGTDIAVVASSPRRRAVETAKALGRPIETDDAFAEIDFGDFEGQTYDAVHDANPEIYAEWMSSPTTVRFPNGESFADVRKRAVSAATALRIHYPAKTIAIVAHGGVNRAIIADALGMPDANIFRIAQDCAAISVIDWFAGEPTVLSLNCVIRNETAP